MENDQDDAKTVVAGSRPQKVSEEVGAQSEYTALTEKVDEADLATAHSLSRFLLERVAIDPGQVAGEDASQGKTRIVVGVAIGAAILLTAGLLWRKYKS